MAAQNNTSIGNISNLAVLYETDGKIGLDCLEDIIEEPSEQE